MYNILGVLFLVIIFISLVLFSVGKLQINLTFPDGTVKTIGKSFEEDNK